MGESEAGPPRPDAGEDERSAARNARLGRRFLGLYVALYGAYTGVNAFRPEAMDAVVCRGLNLAVVSGFLLIVAAFVLAVVYAWLCRAPARRGRTPPP